MDIELVRQLVEQINDLKRRVEHLEHVEYGSFVFLNQPARVLLDSTTRTAPYTNSAVQVSGTAGLPTQIRGILYLLYVSEAAANRVFVTIDNPSFTSTPATFAMQTSGIDGTTGAFTSLDSNGRLRINLTVGSYTTLAIDVWAYVV